MVLAYSERARTAEAVQSSWSADHPTACAPFIEACEAHAPDGFRLGTIAATERRLTLATAPVFGLDFRLDMSLGPSIKILGDRLMRIAPRLVRVPLIGLGSPLSDRCAVQLDPALDSAGRQRAFAALLDELMRAAEREGADVLAVKDLPHALAEEAHALLVERGYSRAASLPVAMLDVPFESEDAYFASLRPSMRADLRRKLRQSRGIALVLHEEIGGLGPDIERLYAATRARNASYGAFDALAPGFIARLLESLRPRAKLVTSWVGDTLAGFNLFLTQEDRAVAYKIGLDAELARRHNLYFVNWMWMVRYAIAHRIPLLEMGQTTYDLKARLGCRLEPSWIYFRHRGRGWNSLFKLVGSHASFASMDPDLRRLGYDPSARPRMARAGQR